MLALYIEHVHELKNLIEVLKWLQPLTYLLLYDLI